MICLGKKPFQGKRTGKYEIVIFLLAASDFEMTGKKRNDIKKAAKYVFNFFEMFSSKRIEMKFLQLSILTLFVLILFTENFPLQYTTWLTAYKFITSIFAGGLFK